MQASDVGLVEQLLREARTWALVDELAAVVVGGLVERHPELGAVLDRWAIDPDLWIRRSALLALLVPLRRGGGDFARFARYADGMLDEPEFFIRKAIGWVLRDTGQKAPRAGLRVAAPTGAPGLGGDRPGGGETPLPAAARGGPGGPLSRASRRRSRRGQPR